MPKEYILKGGIPTFPYDHGTIGWMLYNSFKQHFNVPEALIYVKSTQKISYQGLFHNTCRIAQCFQKFDYGKDTVMSFCSGNNLNFFQAIIAALYVGAIVQPLNENYTEREFLYMLNISKPKVIFCTEKNFSKITNMRKELPFVKQVLVLDCNEGRESFEKFVALNSNLSYLTFKPASFHANEQVALILSSSGTTGMPKCVALTHRNLAVRFAHYRDPQWGPQAEPGGTVLNFMPVFHTGGLSLTLTYLWLGLRTVQMERYEPLEFLKAIQDYKVRRLSIVPAVLVYLSESPDIEKYDLSSLEELICGAAVVSTNVIETTQKRLKLKYLRQAYGLTESTGSIAMTPREDFRIGSCGRVVPHMEVKIVDINTGESLGPRKNGELCCKGPLVCKGYYNNPEATKETIDKEGWLHTGDVAYYDEDEHIYIVERLKDIIKYKSFQVPPAELESLLVKHPKVLDAAVIGRPDKNAGELPMAFIVRKPGENVTESEIIEYISGLVSGPKRIRGGVVFVESIPRNSAGKILRKLLREQIQTKTAKL